MNKYGIIMAGGGGARFWPMSRKKTPKQLLNLTGNELMINETIERLAYTVEYKDIFIVTNELQLESIKNVINKRILTSHVLAEPMARNTAACIGYAAMEIMKKYGDGIMIITPSDAYVKDTQAFTRVLAEGIRNAEEQDKLITIGVYPTFPATGYGYIKFDSKQKEDVKTVLEYKEKPDEQMARNYIQSGEYVWNSGIFIWKASTILKMYKQFATDIYADLMEIGNSLNTNLESETIAKVYPHIRNISVDYAIMEPAAINGEVMVIPCEFGWNDVGSWDMLNVLHDVDDNDNVTVGDVIAINTEKSIIHSSGRLVATVGVNNLVIVETEDAILVCDRNKAQDVRLVVDQLAENKRIDLL